MRPGLASIQQSPRPTATANSNATAQARRRAWAACARRFTWARGHAASSSSACGRAGIVMSGDPQRVVPDQAMAQGFAAHVDHRNEGHDEEQDGAYVGVFELAD